MPAVQSFCGGPDFSFLLSDGNNLQFLKDSNSVWEAHSDDPVIDILFDKARNSFWILGEHSISNLSLKDLKLSIKYKGEGLTCFALSDNQKEIITGTHNGYFNIRAEDGAMTGGIQTKLPCNDLSVIRVIDGKIWFGSE